MNTIMNRDFYEMARKRCMSKPPFGTKIITDADIIFMQEEEIERYRDKIKWLEKALREKPTREFAFGEVGEIETQGVKYTFTITEAVIEHSVDYRPTITIKGDVHIGLSK